MCFGKGTLSEGLIFLFEATEGHEQALKNFKQGGNNILAFYKEILERQARGLVFVN